VVDDACAPNVSVHPPGNPEGIHGRDAVKGLLSFVRGVFPDLFIELVDEIGEGDKVVMRWFTGGTQRGPWRKGVPPTGKSVRWTGISIYRISSGKIVEEWFEENPRGLEQPVGVQQGERST